MSSARYISDRTHVRVRHTCCGTLQHLRQLLHLHCRVERGRVHLPAHDAMQQQHWHHHLLGLAPQHEQRLLELGS